MTFKNDISTRIKADFGNDADKASMLLNVGIDKAKYLKTDRVIRCIIFLAKGNLIDLEKYIEIATCDPRDVMLWAEYEKLNGDFNYKRLRDFNMTFEECSNNVKE
jgi:hypothetical protein